MTRAPKGESTRTTWDVQGRAALLARAPLFERLQPGLLTHAAERMRVKRVPRGSFVFLEGAPATSLNVLAAGQVKVVRETDEGQEVILRLIQPGEIFGGAGGWGEPTYPASARAQDDAIVLQLAADSFNELITREPAFALAVIQELGQRLRTAESRIRELQTERVERRIARALLRLANKTGVKTGNGIDLPGPLTRQDLAELAGTTLSTASRTLSGWDQAGIIAAGREHVSILRPHQLVSIAEDIAPPRE